MTAGCMLRSLQGRMPVQISSGQYEPILPAAAWQYGQAFLTNLGSHRAHTSRRPDLPALSDITSLPDTVQLFQTSPAGKLNSGQF